MAKLVDINFNNAAYTGLPAQNGIGSVNAIRTGFAEGVNGTIMGANLGGRVTGFTNLTMTANSNRVVPAMVLLEGSAINPQNPYFDVWLSDDPTAIGSTRTQGAARITMTPPPANGANSTFLAGYSTGVARWQLSLFNGGGWGFQGIANGSGSPGAGTYRVEIQWDTTVTAGTRWLAGRIYANDGTTLFNSSVATATTSAQPINHLRFGDLNGLAGGVQWYFGEIEVWDTRDGDGTFSNQWDTAAGGVFSTANSGSRKTASYSIPANYSTPQDSVSATFTTHSNQSYGSASRQLDLYIPDGTPPNGVAFPVVLWAHSGYFVTGTKSDIIAHWRNRLLNAGYAVASVGYIKATLTGSTYGTYGVTDSNSGSNTAYGRYPSFIVDYKLAAVRLRDKMAYNGTSPLTNANGYGIDGSKMIASGYSAGGYIALAAALTRDLTDDGTGSNRSLTIAGNSTYRTMETGSAYTGADPEFKGAFAYAAPVSMKTAMDYDWTHNLTNALLWPARYPSATLANEGNAGTVHLASRAFMGLASNAADPSGATFTNTDLTNLIARQHATNPSYLNMPVHYVRGTADYLIHSAHQTALAAAASGTQITYTSSTSPATHDKMDEIYDMSVMSTWLSSATANSWVPKSIIL